MDNLEQVAIECELFGDSAIAINNIIALDKKYQECELVEIYNYFLSVSKNPDVLIEVIKLSDRFRDKSTMSILIDLLLMKDKQDNQEFKDEFTNVRCMCAKAIANYKDTTAVTPILYCLNNKNEHYKVRLSCADALGKIGDKYAVTPLIDIMQDENEKSVYVKESAASALGIIGDMRAIEPLVSILETNQGIMNKFTFLKERVLEALTKLKLDDNERAFKALKSSLSDESAQIRINAIEAIMNSNHPQSVEVIRQCLDDEDEEVRKNALIALYNLQGRDILDEVISLPSYNNSLKEEAKYMMAEYEDDDE